MEFISYRSASGEEMRRDDETKFSPQLITGQEHAFFNRLSSHCTLYGMKDLDGLQDLCRLFHDLVVALEASSLRVQ